MPKRIVRDDRVEVIPVGDIGHCRAGRPMDDFKWPHTHAQQGCGEWRAEAQTPVAASGDAESDNFSLQHVAAGGGKKTTRRKLE